MLESLVYVTMLLTILTCGFVIRTSYQVKRLHARLESASEDVSDLREKFGFPRKASSKGGVIEHVKLDFMSR